MKVIDAVFPGAVPQEHFVSRTCEALGSWGFDARTALACVGLCRDELAQPLQNAIASRFGATFDLSSLGGMVTLGRTGFRAALDHASVADGRRRYVFFSFPHIAIDRTGRAGRCLRPGLSGPSTACGALLALQASLVAGLTDFPLDPSDVEQSLLAQAVSVRADDRSDLFELTRIARAVALEELDALIAANLDTGTSDYAVVSGVQIHGPRGRDYVQLVSARVVVDGVARSLEEAGETGEPGETGATHRSNSPES